MNGHANWGVECYLHGSGVDGGTERCDGPLSVGAFYTVNVRGLWPDPQKERVWHISYPEDNHEFYSLVQFSLLPIN